MKPYDFQEADVLELLAHDLRGFVVAETGAGKTVIGAEAARRSGVPTKLIIAPPGTHEKVWRKTIDALDPGAAVSVIDGSAPGKLAMDALEWETPGYYLMSHQLFTRWKPMHLRPDLVLVDEAHLLANRDSAGGSLLRGFQAPHKIAMSGTMVRNRFENFWNLLRWIYPERSDARDIADMAPNRWIDTFCATKYDAHAPGNRVVEGELVPGHLASLIPCYIQHFKRAECCRFHPEGFLSHLPEPIQMREYVELHPEQRAAMRQMKSDYISWLDAQAAEYKALPLEERKKKALVVKTPIVRTTRLSQMTLAVPSMKPELWDEKKGGEYIVTEHGERQALDKYGIPRWKVFFDDDAPSPKLEKLVEIIKKVDEPVVAATNSKLFAELAVKRLNGMGYRAFAWSSSATKAQRDQALDDFRQGRYDVIVGVTEAIGTGIDGLQDAAGVLVSLNKSHDLTAETQLEGRLDRRGQIRKEGVLHFEIVALGTEDEGIIDKQIERRLKLNRSLRKALGPKRREISR